MTPLKLDRIKFSHNSTSHPKAMQAISIEPWNSKLSSCNSTLIFLKFSLNFRLERHIEMIENNNFKNSKGPLGANICFYISIIS